MCIRIYIFNFKTKTKKENKKTKKAKETKKEKRISDENLTGYDDVVCEFALCTFNLLDRVVNLLIVHMNLMKFMCNEINRNMKCNFQE